MSTALNVVVSIALLESAIITLLACRVLGLRNSLDEWKKAAKELYDKSVELRSQVQPLSDKLNVLTDKYVAKDRECERLRGEKSVINARYEELVMKVTTVGLDKNARHDMALNYIIRGNSAAVELVDEIRQRESLMEQAQKKGQKVEEMSKEEIRDSLSEDTKICDCGSGLPMGPSGYCNQCYIPF